MPYRPAIRPVRHRRSWFPRPPTPLRESGSALMSDTRTRDLSGSFGGGLVDMRLRAGLRGDLSELAPDLFHPALCPPAGAPHGNAARSRTGSGAGRDRRVRRARRLLCLRRRRREDQRPLPAQPAGLPAPARPPPDVASHVRPSAIAHRRRRSSSSAIRGSSRASPGAAARAAFNGHGVCSAAPRLIAVTSPLTDSFHPTARGQLAYARVIKRRM